MTERALRLEAIGRVRGGSIILRKRFIPALDGLEGFSHLIVLFWLHEAKRLKMKLHPKGIKSLPLLGLFATRTPRRPNPIGMTVIPLVRRKANVIEVQNLDAWDGTPILDIKPYTPRDVVLHPKIPDWVKILDQAETDHLRRYASSLKKNARP